MNTSPATQSQRQNITKLTDEMLILGYRSTVRAQRKRPNGNKNQKVALMRTEARRRDLVLGRVR